MEAESWIACCILSGSGLITIGLYAIEKAIREKNDK